MTETRTLPLSAFTVKENKPSEPFGQVSKPPLSNDTNEQILLLRATIPSDVPAHAIVTAAEVRVWPRETMTGSETLSLFRHTAELRSKVRWNTRPSASGTATATLTRTGSAADVVWPLVTGSGANSVAADVQGFISGSFTNYGWRLTKSNTDVHRLYGAVAAKHQPELVFTYVIPGEPPTDLMPSGGAVSVAKPVLTFTVPPGTTAIQVQIDPASNPGTAWQSLEVPATAGVLNLSTTTYPGLANLASTTWRARYLNADTGWSDYSDWFEFSRADQPTLTITSPDSTPGDGTPTVAWTFTDQEAWRARLLDASGVVLADSLEQSGTDATWQPATGLTASGQVGTIEVSARDSVVRVATTGAPTWVKQTLSVTLTPSDALAPFTNLAADQLDDRPIVVLTAERDEGIPDEVIVYRQTGAAEEQQIARLVGADVFTSGTEFEYADTTAPPNRDSVYRIVPVTGEDVGSVGPEVIASPRCTGLFLIRPSDLATAVLMGQEEGGWDVVELASEHQPAQGETVRRRQLRLPPRGDISGDIVDLDWQTADETLLLLDEFAEADSGDVYRYVAGHENLAVRVHEIWHRPTPLSGEERFAVGGWSWRATRDGA